MVELRYTADQIESIKGICAKLVFLDRTTNKFKKTKTFHTFHAAMNSQTNLVSVDSGINLSKYTAFMAVAHNDNYKKAVFSRLTRKGQVRRLDCSLSHDMTRLSFLTVGSCQLSNSNQVKHRVPFHKCCVEYDWQSAGTIFQGIYRVIYERL